MRGSNRRAVSRIITEPFWATASSFSADGSNCRMSSLDGFPRRKRPAHQRTAGNAWTAVSKRTHEPPPGEATREALDIARYVADMTAQLEAMSTAVDLDLLAYFLAMAKAEAELFLRMNAEAAPSDEEDVAADREAGSDDRLD